MTRSTSSSRCRVVLERLSAYLDGDLDPSECRRIEAHASDCARCTAVLEDFREATGLCRHVGTQPVPAAVRKIARAHVRQLLGAETRRSRSR